MKEKKEERKLESSKEGFGIIGLTLGILSFMMLASNGIIVAVLGLIFSIIQQKKYPTRIGKAGIIISTIGIIASIIFIIFLVTYLSPIIEEQISQLNIPLE